MTNQPNNPPPAPSGQPVPSRAGAKPDGEGGQAGLTNPKRGERWQNIETGSVCRVMASPIEGWVVARYKGAAPFLKHVSDWHRTMRRVQ